MPDLRAPEDWYALPEIALPEGEPVVVRVLKLGMMMAFDDRRDEGELEAAALDRTRDGEPDQREELLPTAIIETAAGPKLVRLPRELVPWAFARHRAWEYGWERPFPGHVLFNRIDGRAEATVVDGP